MALNQDYILEQIYTAALEAVDPEEAGARYFRGGGTGLSWLQKNFSGRFRKSRISHGPGSGILPGGQAAQGDYCR